MKLYQLLQSFEFEEIFPTVNEMFPNAQLHRDVFEKAFNMLCDIQPISSKKVIRFELMEDPNSNNMFVGANDSCGVGCQLPPQCPFHRSPSSGIRQRLQKTYEIIFSIIL